MNPRLVWPAAALFLFVSSAAVAMDSAPCCLQSTSRLDGLLNPVKGSDEKFFTVNGTPPNVIVILDTSCSMSEWPTHWPTGTSKGCSDTVFGAGYNPAIQYEGLWATTTTENPNWFNRSLFYTAPGNTNSYGSSFGAGGMPSGSNYASAAAACTGITGAAGTDYDLCNMCLATRGWYSHDGTDSHRRVSGNFLNFNSPKDSGATQVLSQIVKDFRNVRLGIITFDDWSPSSNHKWNNGSYLSILKTVGPSCDTPYPYADSAMITERNAVLANINQSVPFNSFTPSSASLYAAAYMFRSTPAASATTSAAFAALGANPPADTLFDEAGGQSKSICGGCSGVNAVVLITDGEPNEENYISMPSFITNQTGTPCTGGYCGSTNMHKVAQWMHGRDFRADYANDQLLTVYTIGFGLASNANAAGILQATATLGGGRAYSAEGTDALKTALNAIFNDVLSHNTAFSAAAVSSFQSGNASNSVIVPRLLPRKGLPWLGTLWRFDVFNEFTRGVNKNPSENSTLTDSFIVDFDTDIVTEDNDGQFIKKTSLAPAVPFWEAGRILVSSGYAARHIWTVLDGDSGGAKDGSLTSADQLVEFTIANATMLRPYMSVAGTDACPTLGGSAGTLFTKLSLTPATASALISGSATTTQDQLDDLCVKILIQYVRGQDVGDEDGNGNRTETRASVLGDVFHSSPVSVSSPRSRTECSPIFTQCVSTLFDGDTPIASDTISQCDGVTSAADAYTAYFYANHKRDQLMAVGANDGMLHVFNNGRFTSDDCSSVKDPVASFDVGTGREVWAFIPPDQLPRLQEMILGHAYYVDGDLMVRDIWADENLDGQKQTNEFHTLLVAAEGRGGVHYFALEILFDPGAKINGAFTSAADRPGFRWMFPQPCSVEASTFGKTLLTLAPKPPPIGPVLIKNTGVSPSRVGTNRSGVDTLEQWVVALSGGWSPMNDKGRGFYVVDAWNGKVNGRSDNLWWKFEYDASIATADPRLGASRFMSQSVVAPVALVDYGPASKSASDGYFDSAIVGDVAGNVWLARMYAPGEVGGSGNLIGNWAAGRLFETDRADGTATKSNANVNPFYYMPSVTIGDSDGVDDRMRVFIGTGDRYALLDPAAGLCRFDNPLACSKYHCGDVRATYQTARYPTDITSEATRWTDRAFAGGSFTTAASSQSVCGTPGGAAAASGWYTDYRVNSCGAQSFGSIHLARVDCGQSVDGGTFSCRRSDASLDNLEDLNVTVDAGSLGPNRFYSLWAFGATPGRRFDETATSGTNTAATFDQNRLSDRNGTSTTGTLVDVTSVGCTVDAGCTASTGDGGYGWFYQYPSNERKTAGASTILQNGCVIWNDLAPSTAAVTDVCAMATGATSRTYQADYASGAGNCAASMVTDAGAFVRYGEHGVSAPPSQPMPTIQVSITGQVMYSATSIDPGQGAVTKTDVTAASEILQQLYELPVTRAQHQCRHVADGGCLTLPP